MLTKKDPGRLAERLWIATQSEPARDCRIWKPRFDCLVLNQIASVAQKTQHIHSNPVRAGLVEKEVDWPYSSARSYAGLPEAGLHIDAGWRSLGFDELRSGKGS